jgi:phytoene desaturase
MNHADIDGGTWYPMGGFGRVAGALGHLAEKLGVEIRTADPAQRIVVRNGRVEGVESASGVHPAQVVLAAADYHHVETELLEQHYRSYSPEYWAGRRMAPSALLFLLGLDTKLPGVEHHTLFFDEDLDRHTAEIFEQHEWPGKPLFHLCCPSRTDPSVAPPGCEAAVVLIPIASGSEDNEAVRRRYFSLVADRLQHRLGLDIRPHIRVQRSYCAMDFAADHNAFLGNAYGLASTLRQTGPLRPRMKSRKVRGLYFAGQLTVPGPGLPPALISGQVAADLIEREHPLP